MEKIIDWNPWIGCRRISEGCKNCYVYTNIMNKNLDNLDEIRFNKKDFYTPVKQVRKYDTVLGKNAMEYKIPSGSIINVCDNSDFFIEDADYYRRRAWKIIRERKDCLFIITTKRIDRLLNLYREENKGILPDTWGELGWHNVFIKVSVENQLWADYRIEQLLKIPARYKGIEISPILEGIDIRKYISTGQILEVSVGGDICSSRLNCRVTNIDDVLYIREQCKNYDIKFKFNLTGNKLHKDGKIFNVGNKAEQKILANFYNLDTSSVSFDWKADKEELEDIERIELAARIRRLLNEGA